MNILTKLLIPDTKKSFKGNYLQISSKKYVKELTESFKSLKKKTIENVFDESCKSAFAHFDTIKCSNVGGGGVHFYASLLCVGFESSEKSW